MNNYSNPVTVTGNPASFEASGSGKILSLSVPFSPIQDLHGYANPWPAGWDVNKCAFPDVDFTLKNVRYYTENGIIHMSGTSTGETSSNNTAFNALSVHLPAGTYYFSRFTYPNAVYLLDSNGNGLVTNNGAFTLNAEETVHVGFYVYNKTFNGDAIPLSIIEGSSAPSSYTPTSNICPISGRTGLGVYDDPKYGGTIDFNQKFPTKTLSYVGTNYTITSNNDGKFTVNATATASQSTSVNHTSIGANVFTAGHVYAWIGNSDKIKVDLKAYAKDTDTIFKATTASYNNIVFKFDNLTAGTYEVFPQLFDLTEMFGQEKAEEILALENGNTGAGVAWVKNLFPNEYYAYNSGTTTCVSAVNGDPYWKKDIDWTTPAGTVYGGTLDVVTGELVVNKVCVSLNPSWYWYVGATQPNGLTVVSTTSFPSHVVGGEICSHYKRATTPYVVNLALGEFITAATSAYFCFKDSSGGTADEFKDYLTAQATAGTPVQVVYKLATPLTYQLTPTQVELLIGQNNVWSDSNEAVTLTYVIKLFTRYTFKVNNNDYSQFVERDSYVTELTPVFGETIKTMDGVNHTALLRLRGSITVGLNPQTKANTAAICADILQSPVEVQYHCLQRNANVTALMVADTISAQFLSRCLANGDDWNKIEEITLTEL